MGRQPPRLRPGTTDEPVLHGYLLGTVDFTAALAFQRRLVYEVSGDRSRGALVLCEHSPLLTVGREGSRRHILFEPEDLRARQWCVRWVNRGGGCWLHLPGQLALYAVLALDHLGIGVQAYLDRFHDVAVDVLRDFGIQAHHRRDEPGVWVGTRLIGATGIAVRDWVTYYGMVLNINPDMQPFRLVRWPGAEAVTSVARERRGPLRPAMVRERLLECFAREFDFERTSLFFEAPELKRKNPADAFATHS